MNETTTPAEQLGTIYIKDSIKLLTLAKEFTENGWAPLAMLEGVKQELIEKDNWPCKNGTVLMEIKSV